MAQVLPLSIARADWDRIVGHVQAEAPNEACGLLAGKGGQVRRVYLIENEAHSPREYRMEPRSQVRAMLEMESHGWELAAIFHSHPAGPPGPSPTDVAQAYYPEASYLILAPDGSGEWRGHAFAVVEGLVSEVPVAVQE